MNTPEQGPKVIDNDKDFRYAFMDTKNQFFAMRFDLMQRHLPLEQLKERNKELEYLSFNDYIKQEKNLVLAPHIALDQKYQLMIIMHDDLIKRIKNFQTTEELENILEDVEEYIKEDF